MPQDQLGLFDEPPNRRQIRVILAFVALQLAASILILPVRDMRLGEVGAFIPTVDAVVSLGDLITATLLFAQAAVFRSRALTVLGASYLLSALLVIPHALTFPGAFAVNGLLGAGLNTTLWLAIFRRAAFPIAVILYVQLKQVESAAKPGTQRPSPGIGVGVFIAIAATASVTLLTTSGHDLLPPLFLNRSDLIYKSAVGYESGVLVLSIIAAAVLFWKRNSLLDMWLLVVLFGWLIQSLLNLTLQARFTAGWYGLYGLMLFSHLVLMLALIAESNRLYARLAVAISARDRERDDRLMSLDAVAAAISDEVGQPLAALSLYARAGRNRLTSVRPDVPMAIKALDDVIDAGRRTSDVLKSIRAMFAQRPGGRAEFDLNELVHATASVMDRELATHRVSLLLRLDETLPPVMADPVEIQRVLVNLITNAIEAMSAMRRRPRCITIRSATAVDGDVLLDVSDNGAGIAPDATERIFEVFFTTKATGSGLGLSLCRIIVESSGGRLWASPSEGCGVTFHLQLPSSCLATSDTVKLYG